MHALAVSILPTHETWFEESSAGQDWGFFLSPLPLALTALMVVLTLVWRAAATRLPTPELGPLAPVGRSWPG